MAYESTPLSNENNPKGDALSLTKVQVGITYERLATELGFSAQKDGGPLVASATADNGRGLITLVLVAPADQPIYRNGERIALWEVPEGQEVPWDMGASVRD